MLLGSQFQLVVSTFSSVGGCRMFTDLVELIVDPEKKHLPSTLLSVIGFFLEETWKQNCFVSKCVGNNVTMLEH